MNPRIAALAGVLLGSAVALGNPGPATAKALKAAHYLSPKHPIGIGYQIFADELKKDTNGKLTVRIFAAESLLGAKAISDGVRDDVADLGTDTMTYTPSYYPHGVLLNDMAMLGENDMAATFAIDELYLLNCKPCLAEFEKQNQVFTSVVSTSPYVIIAKNDLNSLEKMKGKKLRAGGSLWDRFAISAGATGLNIPTSEMYEALSRGILDGAMYAVGGLKTHGLADVAHQVIMLKLGSYRPNSMFTFNRDVWNKMTPAEREAVFKAVSVAVVRTINEYHKGDEEGRALGKEKGVAIVEPDPGLVKARDQFVENDLPDVIKNAKEKLGLDDAEAFVNQYRTLYAKYEKLVAPIRNDPDKLSALLYSEVFAKADPAKYEVK